MHNPLIIKNIAITLFIVLLLQACSMQKNTGLTRSYKAMNTRYNVFFNAANSYNEGLNNINKANTDDYSIFINMFPISKHENANAAKSNMERAIEKCRKAIKLQSIKKKPERNSKKTSDPDYQAWYNQKEFNPALKDAWMMLAQSEFHKADFLGSLGTFSYIARFYNTDKNLVARCQTWMVRAYAEMGWIYEAEQMLLKINQEHLSKKYIGLFASVNADLLLKKKQYKEAIPFLEIALQKEKDRTLKQRFNYILAQLYNKNGNTKQAFDAFTAVSKLNPPYEMDFNARIYRAELDPNVSSVRKELRKMINNPNNKDYKDQLFYVLGKTYLQEGDTVRAIENFEISADTSTRNGFDKAVTLITLGDIFYKKQNYIKAQPCYDEASKIISVDNAVYERISKRAETLGEVVAQAEIITVQDSLQRLAALPEEKRKEIVQKKIDKLIADEKAAEQAAKEKATMPANFDENFDMMPPMGMAPTSGDWYFYNPTIIKNGQNEFRKKWGKRKLEDNWRRTSKAASLFTDESAPAAFANGNLPADSTTTATSVELSDTKSPAFYLKQIPITEAQIKKSNDEIATAYFELGMIYKEKVGDLPMAIKTFDIFESRFPGDERREESFYNSYLIATSLKRNSEAQTYKEKLISNFPNSKYVAMLSQPDYFDRIERMYKQQDSIYATTYEAYNTSDFATVQQHTAYIQQNFPLSKLLPKFLFLNALSLGKSNKQDDFDEALSSLVEKYPNSDVSSMSKDILALIKQGKEAKTGTSSGTLLDRRDEATKQEIEENTERKFSNDKNGKHRLLLLFGTNQDVRNKLIFNLAAYNFTRFMVKDFDLISTRIDSTQTALSVTNFDSFDEVAWYMTTVSSDTGLNEILTTAKARQIIISEQNYNIMFSFLGLQAYIDFFNGGLKASAAASKSILAATSMSSPSAKGIKTQEKPATKVEGKAEEKAEAKEVINTPPAALSKPNPISEIKPIEPAEEKVPLFKNLFGFRANAPHYVAISVLNGKFDFDKLKAGFDTFNASNYSMLNLKITKDTFGSHQVIIIGSFADANIATSYLLRIVKENNLYAPIKNTDYRNLIGSQANLNIMMQLNAMDTYFEFMQEYYLK